MREYKDTKEFVPLAGPEDLTSQQLELVIEEADRCLLMVDARIDEPGQRQLDCYPPEDSIYGGEDLATLSLAIALLSDAHPGLQSEVGFVIDRFRTQGAAAGVGELSRFPHVMDLIRLSLESLFKMCPNHESYAAWLPVDECDISPYAPRDRYRFYREVWKMLRARLS